MASAKSDKGSINVGDLALVGAIGLAAWSLKDVFGGVGKGVGDLGAGIGSLASQIGGGVRDITSVVPAATSGIGSWGSNIGKSLDFGSSDNWLNKFFATTGGELSQVGKAIDVTNPNSLLGAPVNAGVQFVQGVGSEVGKAFDWGWW